MDRQIRGFLELYLVVVVFFLVVGVILSSVLHQGLVSMLAEVYLFVGIGYLAASTLAWSGVANLYRYSPTLFVGSPSYRQQVVRGQIWKEGRDDRAFLVGLSFSGALLGLGAALYSPSFLIVDAIGVLAALVALRVLRARAPVKS